MQKNPPPLMKKQENLRDSWNYSYHDELDPTVEFFYKPRNISILFLFIVALIYMAFMVEEDQLNAKIGIICAIGVLLLTGLLNFKDGPFIRPHPSVWRVVLAMAVAYQMGLVILLFQTKDNARQLFKLIDPSLGVKLSEKAYGLDCSLTSANIYNQLDVFVLAHTLGWIAKSLVLRDYWLCWVISILFELLEYSFSHHLPNFSECWWDHWILDVLITNWLGIFIGMKLCEYFDAKAYSFRGFNEMPNLKDKLKRGAQQFIPHSWTQFDIWKKSLSLSRFLAIFLVIVLELTCEMNAFYLKYLLWIPVSSRINLYRLIFYFLLCLPAVREGYQFISDTKCKRLGMFAFFAIANIITEFLIVIKFSRNEFDKPMPTNIIFAWCFCLTLLAIYIIWKFALTKVNNSKIKNQ
jgi:phosphatidylserine synthase 2